MTRLGGTAKDPMPKDGRAYVVLDGKWVEVAHDEADGVPASLELPDSKPKQGGSGGAAKAV